MYDAGLVPFDEPFLKLLNQGQLMGPDGKRMSKSRGNVITPDEIVASHGADALRVYELFMAPFDQDVDWSTEGINGARRFLNRVWNLIGETFSASSKASKEDPGIEKLIHRTIKQVTERIEALRFNTVISGLMEYTNALAGLQSQGDWKSKSFHRALETLLILLAPIAPHITEELWALTGHAGSIHQQPWPRYDSLMAKEDLIQVAVQVDGKLRDVIEFSADSSEKEVERIALDRPKIRASLSGKQILNVIVIPGRIVSIVTRRETQEG
jgi:leucyl-tRNA synthetase